ncbi:MAG: N-acetyl-gamma-glutamyl-phosphate reductase [Candidatus Hadarchaeales archaeon]
MIRVSLVGVAGYTGGELLRLLLRHPEVEIVGVFGDEHVGSRLVDLHPHLSGVVGERRVEKPDYDRLGSESDLVFMATPNGVAMRVVPQLLKGGAKVVDLSADYRFEDVRVYEKYYTKHESPMVKGVYGLPELHRGEIRKADLIANPGCYPTAAILALAPLVKGGLVELDRLVVDAISGTSGAGRGLRENLHHPVCGENVSAYSVTRHRHLPEIRQELERLAGGRVGVCFTPHLAPVVRGILCTAHAFLKEKSSKKELLESYREFYSGEPFVRVVEGLPELNYVVGSNYCDIGLEVSEEGRWVVVVSAIDNLLKGGSGQAIQNMNLRFGMEETKGLEALPMRP